MNRVLLIDTDKEFARALGMACLAGGIAIRLAENLCEGVRFMLDAPVSAVLVEARVLRLAGPDQSRLFDIVAPGIPVVVTVAADASTEERVRLELQGFTVVPKPFDIVELLAKLEPLARTRWTSRAAVAAEVAALCG